MKRTERNALIKAVSVIKLRKLAKMDPESFEYSELLGEICQANIGLVHKKVQQMTRGELPYDIYQDLFAAGREGLLEAIKKYDVENTRSFVAYAAHYIFGYIMKAVNKGSNIPLPSNMAGAISAVKAKKVYSCKDPKSPLHGKMVFLDRSGREVECDPAILQLGRGVMSIESLNETSPDGLFELGIEEFENSKLASDSIKQALESLEDRDRIVLLMRYQQDGKFREVAEELGVSIARAQQIEKRAIDRFRSALSNYGVNVC